MTHGQGWDPIDPPGGSAARGPFTLRAAEVSAWDAYAAAVLSNLHDRTMGANVAAEFAATIADAMIIERRKRPQHGSAPAPIAAPAPAPAPAPIDAAAFVAHSAVPARPQASAALPSAAAIGSAAVDGTTPVCECGHATDQHVREAPNVESYLRCVVPGCICGKFRDRSLAHAPAAPSAGL